MLDVVASQSSIAQNSWQVAEVEGFCFAVYVDAVEVDQVGCESLIILAVRLALLGANVVVVERVSERAFLESRHCIGLAGDVVVDDPTKRVV